MVSEYAVAAGDSTWCLILRLSFSSVGPLLTSGWSKWARSSPRQVCNVRTQLGDLGNGQSRRLTINSLARVRACSGR